MGGKEDTGLRTGLRNPKAKGGAPGAVLLGRAGQGAVSGHRTGCGPETFLVQSPHRSEEQMRTRRGESRGPDLQCHLGHRTAEKVRGGGHEGLGGKAQCFSKGG